MKLTANGFGKVSPLVLAVALGSSVMVGCSNDDSASATNVRTGVFVDSEVVGINYRTESQSGTTNENGEFNYVAGETVTFSIGDIELPAGKAGAVVTPLDLANAETPYDAVANNVARLLQTLDSDADPSNGITITQASHTAATDAEITDWSDTDTFEATVATVFAGETLVTASAAAQHLEETLQEENNQAGLTLIGRFSEGQ